MARSKIRATLRKMRQSRKCQFAVRAGVMKENPRAAQQFILYGRTKNMEAGLQEFCKRFPLPEKEEKIA